MIDEEYFYFLRDGRRATVRCRSSPIYDAERIVAGVLIAEDITEQHRLAQERETILESYYTAHLWRGVFVSAGAQFIVNPGYNRDRGPIVVQMARVHLDF